MQRKKLERVHEIVFQGGVDGLWIVLGLELTFVDSDQFFSFAGLLTETVIGNAIKPGGEFCLAAKAADVFVSAQESFLRKIISQRQVAPRELAEQTTDGGLMVSDQLGKGVVIILKKNPRDEIGIIKRHLRSLHPGGSVILRTHPVSRPAGIRPR